MPLNLLGIDNYAMAYLYTPQVRLVRYNASNRLLVADEQTFEETDIGLGTIQMVQMCDDMLVLQGELKFGFMSPVETPSSLKTSYDVSTIQRLMVPYQIITRIPVSLDRQRGSAIMLLPDPESGDGAWRVWEWVLGLRTT